MEAETKPIERIRRVFQCLTPDHTPTQLVTYMSEGFVDKDGYRRGPETCVIDRNRAGQFILRPEVKRYEEQLKALREICRKKPHQFREVSFDCENVVLPEWQPPTSTAEQLQELRQKEAERSDALSALKSTVDDKDKEIAELRKKLEELTKKRGGALNL